MLPPEEVVRRTVLARPGEVVPVGIGVVVPAEKIVELLDSEPLKSQRSSMFARSLSGLPRLADAGS
jgi:hypothetical protein